MAARIAYFDCFSGAAGDMILAALLDAGCPVDVLHDLKRRLGLSELSFEPQRVTRGGIACNYLRVTVGDAEGDGATFASATGHRSHEHSHAREHAHHSHDHGKAHSHSHGGVPHRHLPQIVQIIRSAGLKTGVADRSIAIFQRLAEAEAAVHNVPVEHVHFHEVGAADAIFDICGAVAAMDALGIERVECSPIPTGSGTVKCDHGIMPVPAPATAQLLRGVPLARCEEPGELTTPTAAAILTTLATAFGPAPSMTVASVGYGAGTRQGTTRPNFLRVLVGEAQDIGKAGNSEDLSENDTIAVLECHLDDATGQALAHTFERLLAAGALDAYLVPILMKKGRPGHLLTVLARPQDAPRMESILFAETTTFGVRRTQASRAKLARRHDTVETAFGPIRVKVGTRDGSIVQGWPEYEDCATAARAHDIALREVQQAALSEWTRRHGQRAKH